MFSDLRQLYQAAVKIGRGTVQLLAIGHWLIVVLVRVALHICILVQICKTIN